MSNNNYYLNLPNGFVYCFNAKCKLANTCLRYQAGCLSASLCKTINVVNPSLFSSEKECSEFLSSNGVYYAYGIDHLYDSIPYGVAIKIKQHLLSSFGKNIYYRYKRKEKCLGPEEQDFIRQVFLLFGIKEKPNFDHYEWRIDNI